MFSRGTRVRAASTVMVLAVLASVAGVAFPAGAAVPVAGQQSSPPAAPPGPGGIGIKLLPEANSTETSSYITNQIAPGNSVTRKIAVSNTTTGSVQVVLYAAAASLVNNGFTFANGHDANDASSYTTITPGSVSLAAGTSSEATVTINVPRDGAPGPQYGVVWAEISSGGTGIVQVNRVGIREYLTIGAGGLGPAEFTLSALAADRDSAGHRIVNATIHNTGGRVLNLAGTLALSAGPAATSAGPFNATIPDSVAPEATVSLVVTLPVELQTGPWTAVLTVQVGTLSHTATATLLFPDAPTPESTSFAGQWLVPTTVVTAVVLALAGVLGFVSYRHRVRARRSRPAQII